MITLPGNPSLMVSPHCFEQKCPTSSWLRLSDFAIGHAPYSSSWLLKGALAPHLARPIRVPRQPYSSISPTRVTTERNDHRLMQMRPVGDAMAIAMRVMEKSIAKSWWQPPSHHGHRALQGRARGAPVRPIRLPRRQYSGIWCFIMLLKALQRLVDN